MADFDPETKAIMAKMLGLRLFVVLSKGNGANLLPHVPEHLSYLIALERAGKVFASGPMGVPGSGDGMTILNVATEDEARAIAMADPFAAKAGRSFTIEPWTVNEGGLTLTFRFSDATMQVAP